jgi:hypothetical protein
MSDRRLDHIEYTTCDVFGSIFEYVAVKDTFDSFCRFVPAFLKSDFVRRQWDTEYSRYQYHDAEENLDFAIPEVCSSVALKKAKEDDTVFRREVAYWIGFTYRQLHLFTGLSSAELSSRVTLHDMCNLYPGMHTVDWDMAGQLIIEEMGLPVKE